MNTEQAIRLLQERLNLLNEGRILTWSLDDRAAVSHLMIRVQDSENESGAVVNHEHALNEIELLILKAVVTVAEREEYADYVHLGRLGSHREVHYVLARDLATVVSDISQIVITTRKLNHFCRIAISICRETLDFPVGRSGSYGGAMAVAVDKNKIAAVKRRFSKT